VQYIHTVHAMRCGAELFVRQQAYNNYCRYTVLVVLSVCVFRKKDLEKSAIHTYCTCDAMRSGSIRSATAGIQ
jgi:hypothetical protein